MDHSIAPPLRPIKVKLQRVNYYHTRGHLSRVIRITQYYLPPDRGDVRATTPAEAGTRFAVPLKVAG